MKLALVLFSLTIGVSAIIETLVLMQRATEVFSSAVG
jgi:hypothetical protein